VAVVVLAGCLADGPTDSTPAPLAALLPDDAAGGIADDTTLPTLGPAVDPWGDLTEKVLYDGSYEVRCLIAGGVQVDCSESATDLPRPHEPLIPEGTASLIVETDASGALKSGSYHFYFCNAWHNTSETCNQPDTGDVRHTWRVPVAPQDWDYDYRGRTTAIMGFHAAWDAASVNGLDGVIDVKITARRDPAWVPRAPVDAFAGTSGFVRLAQTNATWDFPAGDEAGVSPRVPDIPLAPIPPGTKRLVYGVTWVVDDCPAAPTYSCRPVPWLHRGDRYWTYHEFDGPENVLDETPHSMVLSFSVPDLVPDDGPLAAKGTTSLTPSLYRCSSVDGNGQSCWLGWWFPVRARVHVLAEAWNDDGDLKAFKARLGVA
jgi:hypothetical protein